MGMIRIEVTGSFPLCGEYRETAQRGGHAAAIGRAIQTLTQMLPEAIARDHELQEQGVKPADAPFGRLHPDR